MEKKQVRLEELLPVIEETLASGGTVRLPITGTSMLPLLVAGRDTVVLARADTRLQTYDLPLYRRENGAFVLHRVVGVAEDGTYICCGDNQWVKEPGIRQEQPSAWSRASAARAGNSPSRRGAIGCMCVCGRFCSPSGGILWHCEGNYGNETGRRA